MVSLQKNEQGTMFAQRGIGGWLIEAWNTRRSLRERIGKQLQLIETLPVGAKRHLMLVRCGEEYFLVGGGLESINAIVKVEGPGVVGR